MATGFSLYQQNLASFADIGPKRLSTEFEVEILGEDGGILQEWTNNKLKYLVKTVQIPSMKKFTVEYNILGGITGRSAGPPDIEHTTQMSYMEATDGRMLKFLKDWYTSGELYKVQISLIGPNDKEAPSVANGRVYTLVGCYPNRDAVDMDVSSNTESVNIQTELIYQYCEEFFNVSAA